jgi:hypothetical protein
MQGAAAAGALSLLPWPLRTALAAPAPVLSGTEFVLAIEPVPVTINGRAAMATGVNGQLPAPILRRREGDTLTLAVTNRLREPSSIHWHGVRAPSPMDGVPGLSFSGIAPGETFVYRLAIRCSRSRPGSTVLSSSSPRAVITRPSIAITSCCCPTGALSRPRPSSAISNSRATITITDSARSAPLLKMPGKKVSPRRSPTVSNGAKCA